MKSSYKLLANLALIYCTLWCCTQENYIKEVANIEDPCTTSREKAFRDFAIILSDAVYNEPTLRTFLKAEALKQVDNDFDVFYPWVKNEIVDGTRSFRDVLKQYDYEWRLETLENELPLLTIYVPDWSWLDTRCFSVKNWDTSENEVAVSYSTKSSNKPLYGKREYLGTIPRGEYLDHPVLIIKNNERIEKRGAGTKGTEEEYVFIDSVYDGTNRVQTKGSFTEIEYNFSATASSPDFQRPSISLKTIDAFDEYCLNNNMSQRDYIFYDMTSAIDSGVVNYNYVEKIARFKLNPSCAAWYDESTSPYGYHDSTLYYEDDPGPELSQNQIKAMEWDEGKLEMVFYVRAGSIAVEKHSDVSIGEAFTPSKVYYKYYTNLFGAVTWRSYYTYSQYLVPKWINSGHNLFTWNLKYLPYCITVAVEEHDSGETITRSFSQTFQYSTNVTTSTTTGQDTKYGYGTGMTSTITNNSSITEFYVQSNDSLGSFAVLFGDPIILSYNSSTHRYHFKMYQTGYVDVIMMPVPL